MSRSFSLRYGAKTSSLAREARRRGYRGPGATVRMMADDIIADAEARAAEPPPPPHPNAELRELRAELCERCEALLPAPWVPAADRNNSIRAKWARTYEIVHDLALLAGMDEIAAEHEALEAQCQMFEWWHEEALRRQAASDAA